MRLNKLKYCIFFIIFHIPILYPGLKYYGIFDESIFYYVFDLTEKGLIPYKDYIIHYPPGIPLIANIFFKTNLDFILNHKVFVWIVNLILQCIIFFLILKNDLLSKYKFHIFYLLIFYDYIFFLLGSEPFTINLLLIQIVLLFQFNSKIKSNYVIIFLILSSLIFLRYDRFLIGCLILLITLLNLSKWSLSSFFKQFLVKYILITLFPILILLLYLYSIDFNLYKSLHYFVTEPFKINRKTQYFNKLGIGNTIFFISIFLTILTFYLNKENINVLIKNNFFLAGIFLVPYAFSYFDLQHAFPSFFFLTLFILTENKKIFLKKIFLEKKTSILFIIFIFFLAGKIFQMKKIHTNCDKKLNTYVTKFSNYKNLYIGSYELSNSLVNIVYLYLLNKNFLPTSKIISEEPGLITKCDVQNNQIKNFQAKNSFFILEDNSQNDLIYEDVCKNTKKYYDNYLKKIDYCTLNNKRFNIYIN